MDTEDRHIRNGRTIVLTFFAIYIVGSLSLFILTFNIGAIVRLILTIGLFYFVYDGQTWARGLLTVGLSVALVYSIVKVLPAEGPLGWIILLFYAVMLYAFVFSKQVKEFLSRHAEEEIEA